MKYLIRCHADSGAEIAYPLEQVTFVLDSLHEDRPTGELAEDVLIALCGVPHGIFSLFGGDVLAEDAVTPMLYDCVVPLPEEVPADLVVRDGQIVFARTAPVYPVAAGPG
jgi:hypothetical protein